MPADRKRSIRRWSGSAALAGAVLLYAGCLLFSEPFEPFLILGLLILFLLGVYLSALASAVAPDVDEPFRVRLNGEGKAGTDERMKWVHVQTRRGRSIRKVILSVLIASVALFVLNHVTGSIPYELWKLKKKEVLPEEMVDWKSHADRLGDGAHYTTDEADDLAGIALTHDTLPALIGRKNPAAVFIPDEQLLTALNSAALPIPTPKPIEDSNEVEDNNANDQGTTEAQGETEDAGSTESDEDAQDLSAGITIEEVARRLQLQTLELAATRFATTPLKKGQPLQIPEDRPYDPRQWIDWLLWALIGMSASLLLDVARHLRSVAKGEGDFLGETSWYWAQLATGPLIAFVILLLFVHIKVDLLSGDEASVQVNLRDYPSDLLLVPAFLLGFYSRVTREVLDQIMRRIFAGAWRAANGDFEIVTKGQEVVDDEVLSESQVAFDTKPPQLGTLWTATDGSINNVGLFTAPKVDAAKEVFVTAISPSLNRSVVKSVKVVKFKFKIDPSGPGLALQAGQTQALTIQPPPPATEQVDWVITPPAPNFSLQSATGPTNTLTVAAAAGKGEAATVKATVAGLSRTVSFEVR